MTKARRSMGLLSLGILILAVAVSMTLSGAGVIFPPEVPSLTLILFGLWILAVAGLRRSFATFAWGTLIGTLGVLWLLLSRQLLYEYLPAILLFVIGGLLVASALRHKRP